VPVLMPLVLRTVPLFVIQAALDRIVGNVHLNRPRLFARMGPAAGKAILIDPVDMPFTVLMRPDNENPDMRAYRRGNAPEADAQIRGTFAGLFKMLDTQLDGDALFFSRDLKITGELDVVVALRNALDDIDGSIASDVAALFGPPGEIFLSFMRHRSKSVPHA
jgi:O2-independent ubiquinone biosynthesis accessory factor UbiT